MLRKTTIILLVATACSPAGFLGKGDKAVTRTVYQVQGDSIVNVRYLSRTIQVKPQPEKTYYWHYAGHINSSRGNYTGQLLHGEFTVQHIKSKALVSKGYFEKGLKSGKWTTWYPDGQVREIYQWEEGVQEGEYYLYAGDGTLVESGTYEKGIILSEGTKLVLEDASVETNESDTTEVKREKKLFLRKIFRKKAPEEDED